MIGIMYIMFAFILLVLLFAIIVLIKQKNSPVTAVRYAVFEISGKSLTVLAGSSVVKKLVLTSTKEAIEEATQYLISELNSHGIHTDLAIKKFMLYSTKCASDRRRLPA